MKTTAYNLYLAVIVLFLLPSCEKIVDIELKTTEPRLVINASITEGSPCMVYLTKTQAFYDNAYPETITGAEIILVDGKGNAETLREAKGNPGLYISNKVGEVNQKYYLRVTVDGEAYIASAVIPEAIPVSETYIYEIKAGNESWYSPSFVFYDPAGQENYYYTIVYVNGHVLNTIYLDDDEYRNGLRVHRILYFNKKDNDDEDLKTGDEVKIEFQTLDKGMYTYYKSLFSVAAGGATNPLTNFSGDVLGCFKAYNTSYAEFAVSPHIIYSESDE